MEYLAIASQVIIASAIFNVWLLRPTKATEWRGGSATTLREEFRAYGLGRWFMVVVGACKILLATLLLAGIWMTQLTRPAALGLAIFMLGAVFMDLKIGDPFKKSLPAFSIFILALTVVTFSQIR